MSNKGCSENSSEIIQSIGLDMDNPYNGGFVNWFDHFDRGFTLINDLIMWYYLRFVNLRFYHDTWTNFMLHGLISFYCTRLVIHAMVYIYHPMLAGWRNFVCMVETIERPYRPQKSSVHLKQGRLSSLTFFYGQGLGIHSLFL